MELEQGSSRWGAWRHVSVVAFAAGLAGTSACISRAAPGATRSECDEPRAAGTTEAIERCEQDSRAAAARIERLEREKVEVEAELARVRAQLVERSDAAARAEANVAQRQAYVDRLEAHVRRTARTLQLRPIDVRRGRVLGLDPGVAPRGQLAPYLHPLIEGESLALGIEAAVRIGKLPVDRLLVTLEAGRVSTIELAIERRGASEITTGKALLGELCGRIDWLHGRPGPGSPQLDPVSGKPLPLVSISSASCKHTTAVWEITVRGQRHHDGATLDRLELTVSLNHRALGNPPRLPRRP